MTDVLATTRCPRCAALVRPGQPWCTLCHADLRPAPTTTQVVLEAQPAAVSFAEDPLTGRVPDGPVEPHELTESPSAGMTGGRHARHAAAAVDAGPRTLGDAPAHPASPVGEADRPGPSDKQIDAMLLELATQTGDPLGGVVGRFDSRGAKIGLAAGLCVIATAAMMLGAFLLAAIFG